MKKKMITAMLIVSILLSAAAGATTFALPAQAAATVDKKISFMQELTLPTEEQYKYKDWKQTTIDFLNYVLDESNVYDEDGKNRKIARFTVGKNIDAYFGETGNQVWSIPPYIGKNSDTQIGEGITVIAAVMSGALCGMDMTNYEYNGNTFNLVKSCTEYFQADNKLNVVLNGGAGGEGGVTFWYELLPGVLFSVLADNAPTETYLSDMITKSARQWRKAVVGMGGASADFYHTSYNLIKNEPFDGNWYEPDAAAGTAYILYSAYALNKNLKAEGKTPYATDAEIAEFLEAAKWSMDYLERIDFSPFYEVLTFLAPYLAARMNAEQGTNYNVAKMINWTLDGSSRVRSGWGMINENWGVHYTNGLMGSLTDGDGYAFAMNTFDAMLGFGPMLKYDARFARDISRWVLCVSRSAQEYYPENYDLTGEYKTYDGNRVWHGYTQSGRWFGPDDERASFLPYEGLRKYRRYVVWKDGKRTTEWDNSRTPYASGDAFTFDWGGDTDYGLYGAAHSGLFGATIFATDVPMILRTDLNALDVFGAGSIPFNMYYNPYEESKTVSVTLSAAGGRLYDTLEKDYVSAQGSGTEVKITLSAGQTVILAEIPAGKEVVKNGSVYSCNGEFIAQDRGAIDLTLTTDGGGTVSAGDSVSGTVKADLKVELPDGAAVDKITLDFGGVMLYGGKTAPSAPVSIDTEKLRNGVGTMTATLTLSGGVVEKSEISVRVMNVVKSPALEYADVSEMQSAWSEATKQWHNSYPDSDHVATTSVSGNSMRVTIPQNRNFGFATSELFYIDFSREPVLELNVTGASNQYAIKIYVDGMEEPTGTYVVKDNSATGKIELYINEELKKEDRTFFREGAHLSSVQIAATGGAGAWVEVSDVSVYHMYSTPVLEEPDSYEWGREFAAVWMSMWTPSGGTLSYNNEGKTEISGGAALSPKIFCDLGQNPVISLMPVSNTPYYVGVIFEGDDTVYRLGEYSGSERRNIEIMPAMRSKYPNVEKSGTPNVRIVVGSDDTVVFGTVNTYYQLPVWGTTVKDEAWLDFVKAQGGAAASLTLDASKRAVIKNDDNVSIQTSIGGMSGKFIVDFNRNPQLAIRVISVSKNAQWRVTLKPFTENKTYVLRGWSQQYDLRNPFTVNVAEAVNNALRGEQNVYVNIEVKGGGNSITVRDLATSYSVIPPQWGNVYTREIATWERGENPSSVSVDNDGRVTVREAAAFSNGLYSSRISTVREYLPYLVLDVESIENGGWYVNVTTASGKFNYGGKSGSTQTGRVEIDLGTLCGFAEGTENEFSIEIGATGEGFALTLNSVAFLHKLKMPEASFDVNSNTVKVTLSEGATRYSYTVLNSENKKVGEGRSESASISLSALGLPTGVYNMYIVAEADGKISSSPRRRAFKQGDVPSVTLGKPANIKMQGSAIVWDEVENVTAYSYKITDADNNKVIASGETEQARFDLASIGLTAFNHSVELTALGDDAVYLTGETVRFEFFTGVAARFTPRSFATMTSTNNGAYGEYDAESGTAKIIVPNNANWGNVASLAFTLDFDKSPVLEIKFGSENLGGYYLQINIDGKVYYLCDNTFDFSDIILDIGGVLASREDGPSERITGKHNVRILFGATGDVITNSPVVNIRSARVIEMTEGRGTPVFGELATPTVRVSGKTASWNAVEHATKYSVVIRNEVGVLISETVTGTSYDFSVLAVDGEYAIEVTAIGDNYYNSDTAVVVFMLGADDGSQSGCGCGSAYGAEFTIGGAALLAISAAILARRKKRNENK